MALVKDENFITFVEDLVTRDETDSLEFKRMLKRPWDLIESVVALANTKWGLLVLWVEDYWKAKWMDRLIGIKEWNHNYAEFLTLLSRNIQPPVTYDLKEIDIVNNKWEEDKIVRIKVEASSDIYSTTWWDTFIRKDKSNRKIWAQEIIRLKYEKGSLKYENEGSGIKELSELDKDVFDEFKKSIKTTWDDWQILKDNWLAIKDDNWWQLTKWWVLLFWKNPDILLWMKSSIRVTYYKWVIPDTSDEPNFVRRPFSIEWPLRTQISKCMDFYEELSQFFPTVLKSNWWFESTLSVPRFVFQEAITNAVIHRNYSIINDIQVRIFDNRIEIESPWIYPWAITPLNIITDRFPRNPIILRTLSRFDSAPNLDIWEWVDRMFQLMEGKWLFDPLYSTVEEKPNSVQVTLFNFKKPTYWEELKAHIMKYGYITSQEAKPIIWEPDSSKLSRILKSLVDSWFLCSEWETKSKVYRLPWVIIM